jgi:argininosuccinate lyase
MSWFWMLQRDKERLGDALKRTDRMPLGSGAVAGSGFPVDRAFLAEKLGFSSITENSIDAVSDRDHIIETLSACALLMMHLSRISEDLIIWSSAEFGFVELPETYSTGSSMMPQKKNPDSLELVRGKTGRVYGNLFALLTVMKGLPFSYGKDMQEDKEPLFDTLAAVRGSMRIIEGVISGSEFRPKSMESVFDDAVFATDVADYLTLKGMPFRKAHEVAGTLVKKSQESGVSLSKLTLEDFRTESYLFEEDVFSLFDLRVSTDRRSLPGGTGRTAQQEQIAKAKELI